MSSMKQLDQRGVLNGLLIPLVLVSLLFVVAASFAGWAYTSRADYKNNSDAKAAAAVAVAEQATATKKDAEFVEKEKLPLVSYKGPAAYGSLLVKYPKTWSAYVSERTNSSTPIDNYFHPQFVPAGDGDHSYALRVQVVNQSYATVLKSFEAKVKAGKLTATAYIPATQPKVTGTRLDGEIQAKQQGSMVIVPIRDKTLKLWTESPDFVKDFNTNILPNYTFSQ